MWSSNSRTPPWMSEIVVCGELWHCTVLWDTTGFVVETSEGVPVAGWPDPDIAGVNAPDQCRLKLLQLIDFGSCVIILLCWYFIMVVINPYDTCTLHISLHPCTIMWIYMYLDISIYVCMLIVHLPSVRLVVHVLAIILHTFFQGHDGLHPATADPPRGSTLLRSPSWPWRIHRLFNKRSQGWLCQGWYLRNHLLTIQSPWFLLGNQRYLHGYTRASLNFGPKKSYWFTNTAGHINRLHKSIEFASGAKVWSTVTV